MRYSTRETWKYRLLVLISIFVTPLLTSVLIIAMIGYLHSEWWHAIPLMNYSTAYWGEVLLGVLSYPLYLLSAWLLRVFL